MEVAPRYWQDPAAMKNVYVSTSGASPNGTQSTNTSAASFTAGRPTAASSSTTAATNAADSARNLATNALAASGHSAASAGAAVTTSKETMIPLSALAAFSTGHTPLGVNHQGVFAAATISFNLAPKKALSDATTAIEAAVRDHRHALHRPRRLLRHRDGLLAGAIEPGPIDRRGVPHRLHRAGHSL